MKLPETLRDPVWQFVGALISLLALIVAIGPLWRIASDDPTIYLCTYKDFPVFASDPAPADVRERLRLIYKDEEIPVTNLFVSQFCLTNRTGRTIEPSDFIQAPTLQSSENLEIIYIRTVRQEPSTAVGTKWKDIGDRRFAMEPTVLNRDETLWIQLLSRVTEAKPQVHSTGEDLKWQALFRGAKFVVGDEQAKVAKPVGYYLQINHEGLAVYLFVAVGLITSTLLLLFLGKRFNLLSTRRGAAVGVAVIACLGWALAEMAVDGFYNKRDSQPWLAWLFVAVLIAVTFAAFRLSQRIESKANSLEQHKDS